MPTTESALIAFCVGVISAIVAAISYRRHRPHSDLTWYAAGFAGLCFFMSAVFLLFIAR